MRQMQRRGRQLAAECDEGFLLARVACGVHGGTLVGICFTNSLSSSLMSDVSVGKAGAGFW